jgi:GTP-binding protein Era
VSTRFGFVALAGRPNAGKSTLLNRIVGEKVAIVSNRPQTTRRAIRGVATTADTQLVLVDLPGVQRPRDPLTERMQKRMESELKDSDAVLFMVSGESSVGHGDRFIADAIKRVGLPCVTAVNKVDAVDQERTVRVLSAVAALDVQGEIFPISAKTGDGVPELLEAVVALLPEGQFLYPPEDRTDLPEEVRIAELIREQILVRTRHELPHAVEVEIEEMGEREDGLLVIEARAWAETESQKGILIGKRGAMVRAIGASAREEIEALEGRQVHLDLSIRVRHGWRKDEALLDRLGIE